MMNFKTGMLGIAAALAVATPVALVGTAMADSAAPELGAPMSEAQRAAADASIHDCNIRLGVVDADGNFVEETRESRVNSYECLHEGYPQYFPLPAQPVFAPPSDWQPDPPQIVSQNEFTTWLSGVLTEEGIAHEVSEHVSGVTFVDYDRFEPAVAAAVSEVMARGDHHPGGAAGLAGPVSTPGPEPTTVAAE